MISKQGSERKFRFNIKTRAQTGDAEAIAEAKRHGIDKAQWALWDLRAGRKAVQRIECAGRDDGEEITSGVDRGRAKVVQARCLQTTAPRKILLWEGQRRIGVKT